MSNSTAGEFFADKYTGLIVVGAVVVIGLYFVLKKVVGSAAGAVSSATNSLSTGIANAYVDATSGPAIQPTGNVVFPDGSTASVQAISQSNGGLSGATFNWNGQQYTLTSQFDALGNRVAQYGPDNSANSSNVASATWGGASGSW